MRRLQLALVIAIVYCGIMNGMTAITLIKTHQAKSHQQYATIIDTAAR